MHSTVVNKAACRRLEKAVSKGPIIGLFRTEIELDRARVCKVSCCKQIQNTIVSTSGYVDLMLWGLRKMRGHS